ncbi:MAG: glycosyltransferase family 9 protein [Candidatus Omnitrophica bacterium]|nr:glycosyltransferase family 9 protein [Candidatus Omnitrophota bacterium]
MTPEFRNILVVRTDRMGDMILTIPAIRALKQKYPRARLVVWVSPSTRGLVDGLAFIDEVIVQDPRPGWAGYLRMIRFLRKCRFDLAVVFHTKQKTNLACFLAGIPMRLGYRNGKWGFFLSHPVKDERHLGIKHELDYCLDLLRAVGVEKADPRLELGRDRSAEEWAERFTAELSGPGPLVALHPDASCPTRHWPVPSFAIVAARLASEMNARVVIVGGPTTSVFAPRIPGRDLTGQFSLTQLAAFIKRCDLLISNDSGPVHLAAAVGTPVISLFLRKQPGINPERWRPLSEKAVLLLNKPGEEIVVGPDNRVISGRYDSITPDEVIKAAARLLCQ